MSQTTALTIVIWLLAGFNLVMVGLTGRLRRQYMALIRSILDWRTRAGVICPEAWGQLLDGDDQIHTCDLTADHAGDHRCYCGASSSVSA